VPAAGLDDAVRIISDGVIQAMDGEVVERIPVEAVRHSL
jgi:hypothetical protein